MRWMPIETAPRDGTWILVEGEMFGGDTSSMAMARYNPITTKIGDQWIDYEWQVVESPVFIEFRHYDPLDLFNWHTEGRIMQWMPLPHKSETE